NLREPRGQEHRRDRDAARRHYPDREGDRRQGPAQAGRQGPGEQIPQGDLQDRRGGHQGRGQTGDVPVLRGRPGDRGQEGTGGAAGRRRQDPQGGKERRQVIRQRPVRSRTSWACLPRRRRVPSLLKGRYRVRLLLLPWPCETRPAACVDPATEADGSPSGAKAKNALRPMAAISTPDSSLAQVVETANWQTSATGRATDIIGRSAVCIPTLKTCHAGGLQDADGQGDPDSCSPGARAKPDRLPWACSRPTQE